MTRMIALSARRSGHPFRRRVPIAVLRPQARQPMGDLQLFAMTFAAGFLAFIGFLS